VKDQVLVIASNFRSFAGPTTHLLDLLNACAEQEGRTVRLVTHAGSMDETFRREARFEIAQVVPGGFGGVWSRIATFGPTVRILRRDFVRSGPLPFVNSSLDLAIGARRAWRRPLAMGYNVFLNMPPRSARLAVDRAAMPWSGRVTRLIDPWAARWCVDRILAHTRFHRDLYLRIGIPEDRITILPHAIDVARVRRMAGVVAGIPSVTSDPVRVFLPRRLVPMKGIREALAACEKVAARRSLEAIVVGRGPLETEVRLKAQNAPASLRVRHIPSTDVIVGLRAMASSGIVLAPSWHEMFGMELLEAMTLGRCVIASNRGGIAEVVRDGETGLLVPPRDPDTLAAALERVVEDERLRRALGEAARRWVEQRLEARHLAPHFLRWYDAVA